jgi:hypothetical protein
VIDAVASAWQKGENRPPLRDPYTTDGRTCLPEDGATVAVLRKGFAGAARQRGGVQPKLFHALPSPFAASAADGHESDDGLRPC